MAWVSLKKLKRPAEEFFFFVSRVAYQVERRATKTANITLCLSLTLPGERQRELHLPQRGCPFARFAPHPQPSCQGGISQTSRNCNVNCNNYSIIALLS